MHYTSNAHANAVATTSGGSLWHRTSFESLHHSKVTQALAVLSDTQFMAAETAIDPADPTVKGHLPCLGSSQPQPTGPGVDPILNCVNATGNGPGTSHNISCCGKRPVVSPFFACVVRLLPLPDLCIRATFHLVELCVQRFVASSSLACLRSRLTQRKL